MRKLIQTVFVSSLVFLFAALAGAQTQGNIHGTVSDPSSAAVPKASVTVTGPNGLVKVSETSGRGEYSIVGLPAGTYILRVAATGFTLFESSNLELIAGHALTVDVKLAVADEKQEITVSDKIQVELDPSKNASATVLSGADLDMLSDDPDDLQNDLQALAGPSAGPNGGQIFVDGFSNGQLPPKSSIREIRVNSNPFSAEFDRVGFGRIEILTKPGTDKLRGSVLYQADTGALDARNPYSSLKPSFLTQQVQGNLSGALTKKSSFFLDFNDRHQDDQALINATTLDASLNPISLRQNVATPNTRLSISPRIDYQFGSAVTLQGRYTWTRLDSDNTGVGGFNLATQGINTNTTTQSAQLTETWVVNARAINETRFQYTRSANSQAALSTVPTINVSGAFTGNAPTQGSQFTNQNSYELQNYTSLTRGAHFVKFGLRLRQTGEDDYSDSNFNGLFSFASLTTQNCVRSTDGTLSGCHAYLPTVLGIQQGLTMQQIIANGGGPYQYVGVVGNPLAHVSQFDIAPFIQDDWRVIPSLTVSLGLRYETQTNIHDKGNFAPRIGLAWGIGGGQSRQRQPKIVLRAGFGIFYDRFALGQVLNADRLNGVVQQRYVVQNPDFFFSNQTPSLAQLGQPLATSFQIDPNLVAPRIIQSAVGIDRQLPKNITVSVNFTDSRGVHQLRTRNIHAPGVDPVTGLPIPTTLNPLFQYESSGLFKQTQLTAVVSARINARYTMFGFYNYAHAHSDTDGIGSFPAYSYDLTSEWSRASFDIRHRFVTGGNVSMPYGMRLNPFIIFSSAAPFNIVVGQDLNGDTISNDRPTFAGPASIAASNAAVAAGKAPFVFATPYGMLNTTPQGYGEALIPRNLGQGFGVFTVNMRVSKSWGFGESGSSSAAAGRAGGGGGRGGAGFGGGRPGGGGPPAGGPGGLFGGAATAKRYNLTVSVEARNLLNSVNPGTPVGILGSPQFGQAQGLFGGFGPPAAAGGGGGGGNATQSANRRLELQLRFSF